MNILTIGRDANNEIVLDNNFVSRRHAQLIISDNGQVLIKDLGSSNGTFVNGNKVTESYLRPGDLVKCASASLNWQQYILNTPTNIGIPVSASLHPVADQFDPIKPSYNQEHNKATALYAQNTFQKDMNHNNRPQDNAPIAMQQNVIVMGKAKSVGVAFLLAFFFGPLGLLYASVTGGIVMFVLAIPIGIFTAGIGFFFINPICSIWAVIAANQANASLQNRAAGLINNNFQR
jgi:hypothetical protein